MEMRRTKGVPVDIAESNTEQGSACTSKGNISENGKSTKSQGSDLWPYEDQP
jgi:hypothetical protein